MNIITVSRQGILDTPILVENDITAQATFDELANELAGEDVSEINLHFDYQIIELNNAIKHLGIEVNWFCDVEVNDYVNEEE